MERLRVPYRIVLLLVGLIVFVSMAGAFLLLPASSHLRGHLWKVVLVPAAYILILYTIARHPGARRLRYLISASAVLLVAVLCYDLCEDLPAIFLLYLFPIATTVLFWDMATAIFTAALSTLTHATVMALIAPLTANLAWNTGLQGITFFLMAILAGVGVEEWRLRTEQLSVLNAIAQTVSRSLELDTVLSAALDKVLEATGFEPRGGVFLLDSQRQELHLKAHRGLSPEFVEREERIPMGECLCGQVAQSGEMLYSASSSQDTRLTRMSEQKPHSHLIVPLKAKGKVMGVMFFYPEVSYRPKPQELQLLASIGNQIGVAIENARLYQQAQRRLDEMRTLQQTFLDVTAQLELPQLLRSIVERAAALLGVKGGAIYLYHPEVEELELAVSYNLGRDLTGTRLELGEGLSGKVAQTGEPITVEDYRSWEGKSEKYAHDPFTSVMGIPLKWKGEILGVINATDVAGERQRPFDENDVRFLSIFANQAAIAIENARLFEAEQRKRQQAETLRQAAQALSATLDLQQVFKSILSELQQVVPYDSASVQLLKGDRLEIIGGHGFPNLDELLGISFSVEGDNPNRQVMATRAPFIVEDAPAVHSAFREEPHAQAGIRAWLGVPLLFGDRLIGMIALDKRVPGFYTEEHARLALAFAAQAAIAIENARLYEKEQRLSTQRKTIAEVGRTAAAILDMDTLLARVVDLIAENFGYYFVHVFEVDADAGYAVFKAGAGEAGRLLKEEGVRLKIGEEGINGWVAQHGQPLLVNDVSQEPHYYHHPALPDTRSELAVPIRVGGRIIGVLDVQSMELDAFDEGDLETLQTLADQLAVAMENARLYEETKRLAITDGLTGLYNLRYFYETLEKEIRRSERYHRSISLIILDIDDFKAYNDLYGHLAGDDLLIELAQLMSKVTRRTDTLARYGGEEFAIILPETETGQARFLSERLQQEVREHRFPIQDDQTIGRIAISLGVATYPHHADSAKALVGAADKALLRAKQAGKNRLFVCGEELTELQPR